MIVRILLLLISICFLSNTYGAEKGFENDQQFQEWLMNYYLEPDPSRVSLAMSYLSETGFLGNAKRTPPIFGFLAGVLSTNPTLAPQLTKELSKLPDEHFSVVLLGLWYSNIPNAKSIVYSYLDESETLSSQMDHLRKGSTMPITKIPLEQGPWVLDALWGNFFATGKTDPVERITEALPWIDVKGDINRLMVGGAARWSLSSNIENYERVSEIVEKLSKNDPENQHLLELIKPKG